MKKINHLISALIMAAMTAGFASCSSSDEPSSVSDNTPKELTLTIMSTKPATKAALEGSSAPTDAQEKTINRITVGIFNSTGTEVRTIQELSERCKHSLKSISLAYCQYITDRCMTFLFFSFFLSFFGFV